MNEAESLQISTNPITIFSDVLKAVASYVCTHPEILCPFFLRHEGLPVPFPDGNSSRLHEFALVFAARSELFEEIQIVIILEDAMCVFVGYPDIVVVIRGGIQALSPLGERGLGKPAA